MNNFQKYSRFSVDTLLIVLLFGLLMLPISFVWLSGVKPQNTRVLGIQRQPSVGYTRTTGGEVPQTDEDTQSTSSVRDEVSEVEDTLQSTQSQSTQSMEADK
jgi:hypothetical protein